MLPWVESGYLRMALTSTHEFTQLLKAWTTGDESALGKLTPLAYEQLRQVAQSYMSRE